MKKINRQPEKQTSGEDCTANSTTPPLKWKRVLSAMLAGESFNRFEAERQLHDHCLHTTVSELEGRGVCILRQWESVPGYQNIPTRVVRYWLAPESRSRAMSLLGKREAR